MLVRTIIKILFPILLSGIAIMSFMACKQEADSSNKTEVDTRTVPELQALNEAVSARPDDPESYVLRAQYYYANAAYDLAEKDLLSALQFDSSRAEWLHLLADSYMDNFQSRKALLTMKKAAERNPERIPTLLKLSEFQLILKQYEDGLKTLDQIIRIDPQSAEAYFMTGAILRETGDRNRAINAFQRSTELDPDNMDAWIALGNLFDELKNPIALKYFDNALKVAPENPFAIHAKAYYLQNHGQPMEAIEMYKDINRRHPGYVDAYLNTGVLYLTMDSLEQAWQHFNIAVNNSPMDPRGYYFRGLVNEQKGDTEAAIKDYKQALAFDPNYLEAKEALEILGLQ